MTPIIAASQRTPDTKRLSGKLDASRWILHSVHLCWHEIKHQRDLWLLLIYNAITKRTNVIIIPVHRVTNKIHQQKFLLRELLQIKKKLMNIQYYHIWGTFCSVICWRLIRVTKNIRAKMLNNSCALWPRIYFIAFFTRNSVVLCAIIG